MGKQYDDEWIAKGTTGFSPNVNYEQDKQDSLAKGDILGATRAEDKRNMKLENGYNPGEYKPTYELNYKPKYEEKIGELRDKWENYKGFSYNPMKDEAYKSLTHVYDQNARKASSNALAQVAAANGGRVGSGAVIASDLAYQNKMGQLEAEIPELRQLAYNMYLNEKNDLRQLMGDYVAAENENYGRWSDNYERIYRGSRDLADDARADRQYDLDEKYTNAQIDSLKSSIDSVMRSDALQESMALGYVTESAAEILGVKAGTAMNDVILRIAEMIGYVPDEFAKQYGFPNGGTTVQRDNVAGTAGAVAYNYGRASAVNDAAMAAAQQGESEPVATQETVIDYGEAVPAYGHVPGSDGTGIDYGTSGGGSSGSTGSSGSGSSGSGNKGSSGNQVNYNSAYNAVIKGATPEARQQIAAQMLESGQIDANTYSRILSELAG